MNSSVTLNLACYILLGNMFLNVFIWNVRGVMFSAFTLSKMLENFNVDIAILSEHKLLPQSKWFLDSVKNNYSSYVKTDSSIDPYKSFS